MKREKEEEKITLGDWLKFSALLFVISLIINLTIGLGIFTYKYLNQTIALRKIEWSEKATEVSSRWCGHKGWVNVGNYTWGCDEGK